MVALKEMGIGGGGEGGKPVKEEILFGQERRNKLSLNT